MMKPVAKMELNTVLERPTSNSPMTPNSPVMSPGTELQSIFRGGIDISSNADMIDRQSTRRHSVLYAQIDLSLLNPFKYAL